MNYHIKLFTRNLTKKIIGNRNFCDSKIKLPLQSDLEYGSKHCLHLVKTHDYENYICSLLLKGEKRREVFAIRALNVEISRIMQNISEVQIGQMKLNFWRDSIEKCFDKTVKYNVEHPVLQEINKIIQKNNLSKIHFRRLIKARDRPSSQSFVTKQEMEQYAEATVSSINYMFLELWDMKNLNVDHAASHLGKAQGITNLLRSIPFRGRQDAINIPQEVLLKHNVSHERIIRDKINDKGVEDCVYEIAMMAHQHLEQCRKLAINVPKHVRELFLPAVAVDRYLERLRKARFRLSEPELIKRDQLLPLAYYWYKIRSVY